MRDERPRAMWHPLPVSEIWIAVGVIAMTVGLVRGSHASAAVPLVVGLGLVGLGVLELTAREHLAGYRRHTLLLGFLLTAAAHGGVVMALPFRLIGAGALALDLVVFAIACGLLDAAWRSRTATAPDSGETLDA